MEDGKIIKFPELKIADNDFEIELGVEVLKNNVVECSDLRKQDIINGINEINETLSANNKRIDDLNIDITRLSNSSDGIDYMVAVASGILSGIIDSFWVGEFSFERGNAWSDETVNNFVKKVAKKQGYNGDDLEGAIKYLESGVKHKNLDIKGFGAPSDSVTDKFGGGRQHHLRDFAHHPTPVGLIFSMLTQFSGKSYGTDKNGFFMIVDVENKTFIGKDVPQKFLFGTVFWFFHMISDMAGSSSNPGAGTGLPGPLLSLLKELSALPIFNSLKNKDGVKEFSLWISKLFNGTLLAEHDENGKIIKDSAQLMQFDLRAELGVAYELGRQALPVILNECIVRGFYFIRRLATEIKEKEIKRVSELKRIDWDRVKPAKNRTIVRMLTIATGTFTLVDMADAAIRGDAKEFLLRVNFVGVGRFAIAVATDVSMGLKRDKLRNERIAILSEQLHLMNAKIYYMQADAWVAAETTEKTINEAVEMMEQATIISIETWKANRQSMRNIGEYSHGIEKHNSGLIEDISDILKWG
ncbi:hypothetical protein [Clostridium isatidis]|uniref:hypothetical protein n=1 Tax=Clostridium isatidis TaxID=182773 RepID=UPI003AB0E2CF